MSSPTSGGSGTPSASRGGSASGRAARSSSARSVGRPAARSTGRDAAGQGSARGTATPRTAGASRPRTAGASRPSAARTGASRPPTASRGRTPAPPPDRPSTTWVRGAVLLTILVVLAVTLAPTARSLLRQRGDLAALQEKVVQQQQSVADLQREQARWADPAYVEQQARERLKFVKVGDRSYSVIDPATEIPKPPASAVVAAPKADANAPWYGQVWQSVRLADQPTAGMAPVPDK